MFCPRKYSKGRLKCALSKNIRMHQNISTGPTVLVGNYLAQEQPGCKLQQSESEIQMCLTAGTHSAGHTQPAI